MLLVRELALNMSRKKSESGYLSFFVKLLTSSPLTLSASTFTFKIGTTYVRRWYDAHLLYNTAGINDSCLC